MVIRGLTVVLMVVALMGLTSSGVVAGEGEKKPGQAPDEAAVEKMMAEFAELTPQHKQFEAAVGRWKAESKSYWADPDRPELSTGSATFKLLMGGRYLQQRYRSKFGGRKFEGLGITGYDKAKKKYVSLWIDNMGTGFMLSEGEYDEATRTATETAESDSPTGKMKLKIISKDIDKDKFVMTMYIVQPDGGQRTAMEITYTREQPSDAAK